ncbi:putative fyve phd zinc finger [Erysiphe necator]|uniref:Putative fyve phd zinc finger n=1 Tax=Uncinula necator TaxID=52586 RepID=A0A0B1PBP7_UNCNE|nr:putative fyve phd zinc finger [Erysiphe necator]
MDTTRRSLRAFRASQPLSISNQVTNPSSRAERTTRSTIKLDSSEKTTISGPYSTLKPEESVVPTEDSIIMQTRRKRGRTEEQRDKPLRIQASQVHNLSRSDQVGDDDEVVRCICGLDDYSGLPKSEGEVKSESQEQIVEPLNSVTDVAEDLAGFFLQCDICKVWQHGGCVGIESESSSPDEYFCERCRKDLHKIFTATNGQRYSHYLPLYQSLSRLTPRPRPYSKDEIQSPKTAGTAKFQSLQANAKRRSTMNSRDAAYDEEEQIRRAIEASKDIKAVENVDGCLRRGKRGRSNSQEKIQGLKRQRTDSASSSSSSSQEFNQISPQPESDDGGNERMINSKKPRSTCSKTLREKDLKDDKEKSRSDAVAKRNGRTERRRTEDQETQKELSIGTKNTMCNSTDSSKVSTTIESLESPTLSNGRVSDNSSNNQFPIPLKKSYRNSNSRKGKLAKNNFTRESDQQIHDDQHSHRSQSREAPKIDDVPLTFSNKGSHGEPRVTKFKGNPSKVSMTDMKRRISAILDFISRTQLEMASESIYHITENPIQKSAQIQTDAVKILQDECNQEGCLDDISHGSENRHSSKEFKDLSCRDMMDVLTKQLIKWQKDFLH